MTTVMNDNRKYKSMTADEADALFAQIAKLELEVAKIAAAGDRELARIKDKYVAQLEPMKAELPGLVEKLKNYVGANKERFIKPRARKTEMGQYGLRNVSNLSIEDETRLLSWAREHNTLPELFDTIYKVRKEAVANQLSNGQELPGCEMQSGERAFYKVSQELVSAAKNGN